MDNNNPFDIAKEKLKIYEKEVLSVAYPGVGFASWGGTTTADVPVDTITAELSSFNLTFKNTPLYYKRPLKFIHFTSLENAINIINSRSFRLYDYTCLKDPNELLSPHSDLDHELKSVIAETRPDLKKEFFSLSFCKADDEADLFDLWRLYGRNGRGMAIVFTIDETYKDGWYNFLLSEISYGHEHLQKINKLFQLHKEFVARHSLEVSNYLELLLPFLAFTKRKHYHSEKEVRLVKRIPNVAEERYHNIHSKNKRIYMSLNGRLESSYYYSLPILNREEKKKTLIDYKKKYTPETFEYARSPFIEINEIIIGFDYTSSERENISDTIFNMSIREFGVPIAVKPSVFTA